MTSGALLYIAMRWFDRLLAMVGTIVLARLLTPDDYGIVALASIAVGLVGVFLDVGINLSVVQRKSIDQEDIDTAWSLQVLQSTGVAVILSLSATFAGDYFGDSRITPVIYVLAFACLLDGLTSIGPIIFQKRQEYAREVTFFMMKRASGFAVTVLLALWLRSYWALVIGSAVTGVVGVALSYAMYKVAPRLTFSRWRSFMSASIWITLRSIGGYTSLQMDKLVVGRRDGMLVLGSYSLSDQISSMPTTELLAPMSRALFPAMAAVQEDMKRLRAIFVLALGIQATLALPASIGLALVAEELVSIMLGEKWLAAVSILAALALAAGTNALTHAGGYLLTSLGKFRALALRDWGLVAAFALLVFVAYPSSGAIEVAWLRVALGAMGVISMAWLTIHYVPAISVGDILNSTARPILASLSMVGCVVALEAVAEGMGIWARFVVKVTTGAMVYPAVLLVLWQLAGKPPGAERWLLEQGWSALRQFGVRG